MKIGTKSTKNSPWTFIDDKSSKGSSSEGEIDMDFEVVPPKKANTKNDFEIIPVQRVKNMDEGELQMHENHFLFGTCFDSSDSEIEVLEQPADTELYSKMLLKNLPFASVEFLENKSPMFDSVVGIGNLFNESLDDSDVEVLLNHQDPPNESLEIIFSNDANNNIPQKQPCLRPCLSRCHCMELFDEQVEEKEIKQKFIMSNVINGDYGLDRLFETDCFEERKQAPMKTSTLVLLLSVCILVAIHAGNDFGSLFLSNKISRSFSPKVERNEMFVKKADEQVNMASSRSESKVLLKTLLDSFRQLEEKHAQVLAMHDVMVNNYNVQKQMTWYWRRRAEDSGYQLDEPNALRGEEERNIPKRLENIKKCAALGKTVPPSLFSFSKCLSLISSEDAPDFLSPSLQPEKPLTKHARKVWSGIQNVWKVSNRREEGDKSDQLRRIFQRDDKERRCMNLPDTEARLSEVVDCEKRKLTTMDRSVPVVPEVDVEAGARISSESNEKLGDLQKKIKTDPSSILEIDAEVQSTIVHCDNKRVEVNVDKGFPGYLHEHPGYPCNTNGLTVDIVGDKKRVASVLQAEEPNADQFSEDYIMNRNTTTRDVDCGGYNVRVTTDVDFPGSKVPESSPCDVDGISITIIDGKIKIMSSVEDAEEDREDAEKEKWYKSQINRINFDVDLYKWTMDAKVQDIQSSMERKFAVFQREHAQAKQLYSETTERLEKRVKVIKRRLSNERNAATKVKNSLLREVEKQKRKLRESEDEFQRFVEKVKKKKECLKRSHERRLEKEDHQKKKNDKRVYKIAYYKTLWQQVRKELSSMHERYEQAEASLEHHQVLLENLSEKMKNYRKLVRENEKLKILSEQQERELSLMVDYKSVYQNSVAVPTAVNDGFRVPMALKEPMYPGKPSPPKPFHSKAEKKPAHAVGKDLSNTTDEIDEESLVDWYRIQAVTSSEENEKSPPVSWFFRSMESRKAEKEDDF